MAYVTNPRQSLDRNFEDSGGWVRKPTHLVATQDKPHMYFPFLIKPATCQSAVAYLPLVFSCPPGMGAGLRLYLESSQGCRLTAVYNFEITVQTEGAHIWGRQSLRATRTISGLQNMPWVVRISDSTKLPKLIIILSSESNLIRTVILL